MNPIVTVFGASRVPPESQEYESALELGRLLASAGFTVCNGGFGGTMEAAAKGASQAGGHTIGVTVGMFGGKANKWIKEEIARASLVERLQKLIELGEAYVILRGGTGTLLELAAVWEFVNKGIMESKPIIVLGSFWNPVIGTLKDELIWEGLGNCTSHVTQAATPRECVELLKKKFSR